MNYYFDDLKRKRVFITGGGSGIGAALTRGFLEQGAQVSFTQRSDAEPFLQSMEECTGHRPSFYPCDLSQPEELRSVMETVRNEQGSVEILINNAGNDVRHTLSDYDSAEWDANHAVNLRPYFLTARAVAPSMIENGGGVIINYSSISYMMGNAGYPAYVTANAAITGLTRALARELGPHKIRVNALAPGWVMTQKQLDLWASPENLEKHLEKQCLQEYLQPEDMVAPTLFLASEASSKMTGQVMSVDGGVMFSG